MYLVVQTGYNRGRTFEITDQPLVIGRDEDCGVSVKGRAISRRHCELWLEKGTVRIRDLGSRNGTHVNGDPVEDAILTVGDEIAVGAFVFIASDHPGKERPAQSPEPTTTVTVSLSRAYYLHQSESAVAEDYQPRTVLEFRDLYLMGRRYSRAVSREELVDLFAADLREHFRPESFWLAWYLGAENKLAHYAFEVDGHLPPPEAVLRRAIEESSGILQPSHTRTGGKKHFCTTLAAPLQYGNEKLGVAACQAEFPRGSYDEQDLEFLVAIADGFAPYVRAIERQEQLQRDAERILGTKGGTSRIVGKSKAINRVKSLVQKIAKTDINVVILGETGTGKELVARLIHDLSPRAMHPFIAINCAAVPSELFESEMFGHEKGAFTGATRRRTGWFEQAHGGTLFLDEIGDMPRQHQVSLLRAIELGEFRRVGGESLLRANVRVIAATGDRPKFDLPENHFRFDLYQRLAGMELSVPPLRERKSDIALLAEHFLSDCVARLPTPCLRLHPGTLAKLESHPWPGNVRELRACIERACALASGVDILPDDVLLSNVGFAASVEPAFHPKTMDEMQREHIIQTLNACDGNISAAAQALGISRPGLHKMLKRHGIER